MTTPQDPYGQQSPPPDGYEGPPGYGRPEEFFTRPLPPPAGYDRAPGYNDWLRAQQAQQQGAPQPGFYPNQTQPVYGPPMPPQQQPGRPRRKRHTGRNVFLSLAGVVVLIIVIAVAASSGSGSGSPAATASTPAAQAEASSASAGTPGLGQPVSDGDFRFTVKDVTCGAAAAAAVEGTDGFGEKIPAGAAECIVTMTVSNDKSQAQTFLDSAQYAYDQQGRKLSADTSGAAFLAGDQELTQLNPGITVTARVAFQIPSGDKIVRLELHDSLFSEGATVQVAG